MARQVRKAPCFLQDAGWFGRQAFPVKTFSTSRGIIGPLCCRKPFRNRRHATRPPFQTGKMSPYPQDSDVSNSKRKSGSSSSCSNFSSLATRRASYKKPKSRSVAVRHNWSSLGLAPVSTVVRQSKVALIIHGRVCQGAGSIEASRDRTP
jgi:hypothetical protein